MTLPEWTKQIMEEAAVLGLNSKEYEGFPLIEAPKTMEEGVKFLKHRFSMPVNRTFYAESVLITPAGVPT